MKRARDRWIVHLFIGVLAIAYTINPKAEAVKATSLIFRSTTTTTTEAGDVESEESAEADGVPSGEGASGSSAKSAPSNLTGIPQIDYIYDPNLPRELNGYNLSSYPFYETVPPPEEMDFKCDGLHDGFYASVPHKCQVYHHCLYGTRYDFLCANYTAFDQKTFICHFVSEVDCDNSPKYFNRNDDLYIPSNKTYKKNWTSVRPKYFSSGVKSFKKKTDVDIDKTVKPIDIELDDNVTVKPIKRQKIKKFDEGNEALYKATTSSTLPPSTTTRTTTTPAPPPPAASRPRPGGGRRPFRRRRPSYEYYDDDYYYSTRDDDDYYEDDRRRPFNEGRANNRRPRPRPSQRRPSYDDYEDERFDRRQEGRTRYEDDFDDRRSRPRKPTRRPSEDRERPEDTRKPYSDDDRFYDRNRKNRPDDRRPYDDDRRGYDRPRRPHRDDERREDTSKDERPFRDERPSRENRPHRDERPTREESRPNRHPIKDDYDDYEEDRRQESTTISSAGLVKPNGDSIYSKPRVPPRISRPVPTKEKEKYKYVTSPSTKVSAVKTYSEEYYDDYESEKISQPKRKSPTRTRSEPENEKPKPPVERTRPSFETENSKRPNFNQRKPEQYESRRHYPDDVYEEDEGSQSRKHVRGDPKRRPVKTDEEYYYDEEEPKSSNEKKKESSSEENVNRYRDNKYNDERLPLKTEKESTTLKPFFQRNKPTLTTTTTTTTAKTTTEALKETEKPDTKPHYVRVVKRPFLPSRGGSPYLPRGLQPLGGKNFNKTTPATTTTTTSTTTESILQGDYSYESDYDSKEEKTPFLSKITSQDSAEKSHSREQTTQKVNPFVSSLEKQNFRQYSYTQKPQVSKPFDDKRPYTNPPYQKYESNKEYTSTEDTFRPQDKIKITYEQNFKNAGVVQQNRFLNGDYLKAPDRLQTFKPSPQISDPYKPTNRPFTPKIPENISIKQNLADPIENEYDVTLNDALNPTISNLTPVRNFPSPFIPPERDYTFSRFRNSYNSDASNSFTNYQPRPNIQGKFENSQRYIGHGYVKNDQITDTVASGSEMIRPHVISVRTPQSYYIPHPGYASVYSADETNSGLRPSHVTYRQVELGDFA